MHRLIKTAVRDLRALGIEAHRYKVQLDDSEFEARDGNLGLCVFVEGARPTIYLRPNLKGSRLYRVYLHELAHAMGVEHAAKGIMAPYADQPEDLSTAEPTPEQRKRWCYSIAVSILKARRRRWRPS